MTTFTYPRLRAEVVSALESLGDVDGIQARWGDASDPHYYDDLDLCVTALYDLAAVLPNPADSVGAIITADEVPALERLENTLGLLLDSVGNTDFRLFVALPAWSEVVMTAREAHDLLVREPAVTEKLKPLGGFRELREGQLEGPSLSDREPMPAATKALVVEYLASGDCLAATTGPAHDVLTGESIGALHLMTDGEWVWHTTLTHYLERYDVALPTEFIASAVSGQPRKLSDTELEALADNWMPS